jgi:hypothetical protein
VIKLGTTFVSMKDVRCVWLPEENSTDPKTDNKYDAHTVVLVFDDNSKIEVLNVPTEEREELRNLMAFIADQVKQNNQRVAEAMALGK